MDARDEITDKTKHTLEEREPANGQHPGSQGLWKTPFWKNKVLVYDRQ